MKILVVAEHDNKQLAPATLSCVAAALELKDKTGGGEVTVLLAGSDCAEVTSAASKIDGIQAVWAVDDAAYAHGIAENIAKLIHHHAKGFDCFMAAATTTGKNIMPRLAAMLDVMQISDIISVESADTFKRPIYAGNIIATVQSSDAVKVITVRATAFDAVGTGSAVEVKQIDSTGDCALSSYVSEELAKSERPELTAASTIISGGRGMGEGANFKLIEAVADKLGAAIGASRAAVDAGFVPNDMQVGQTGKIVAPELYIAVGISGAIQHLAGMKDSKVIVAINKDEDAPIFQIADYGLVADLFEALPELEKAL
jgi:electron transfer flavoprotein alpha subunit